ncbi:DUF1624 domain-containing protein [Candidatus Micrarchaeota archaeon]|nr:DUF1624 domain-containing protein [Candidatus Micrarchaeota archaeon]
MVQRLWELDVTRGIAVVLMVFYHLLFDLNYMGLAVLDFQHPPLLILQRLVAFLFLSLVGVSLVLTRLKGVTAVENAKRAAGLFGIALLITAATFVYPGSQGGMIVFGIIHFIAVAVLLGYFFTRLPQWFNLAAGVSVLGAGFWLSSLPPVSTPWLLWLGLPPIGFYTLDYYPLIPWFGVVLIGIFTGQVMDPFSKPISGKVAMPKLLAGFSYLGRNALVVYLVHQPILFGLLLGANALLGV